MKKSKFYYTNGSELLKNDKVLINDRLYAYVEDVLIAKTKKAADYSCEEGGFILVFENGDVQVWPNTDEDIKLIRRK